MGCIVACIREWNGFRFKPNQAIRLSTFCPQSYPLNDLRRSYHLLRLPAVYFEANKITMIA
jgi:hypothetical protein